MYFLYFRGIYFKVADISAALFGQVRQMCLSWLLFNLNIVSVGSNVLPLSRLLRG
jgi:hypothetical protein